jgi:outer membrane protein assembly factor BamA
MGSRFALLNAELRFPLLVALWTSPLPLILQAMTGCFFLDAGALWSEPGRSSPSSGSGELLLSVGTGIRLALFGFPLKLDVAWRYAGAGNFSKPVYLLSLGYDF